MIKIKPKRQCYINSSYDHRLGKQTPNMIRTYGRNNEISLDPTEYKDLKTKLEQLAKSTDKLSKGDKYYTNKLSGIPRFKMKNISDTWDLSKTTKLENSSVIILNKDKMLDIISLLKNKNSKQIHSFTSEFIEKYKSMFTSDLITSIDEINSKYPELNCNEVFYIDDYYMQNYVPTIINALDVSKMVVPEKIWYFTEDELEEYIKVVNYLDNNLNVKVIYDEDLLETLNSNGITLDTDIENNIKDMLFNKDEAVVKLGVEMLSNIELTPLNTMKIGFILNTMCCNGINISKYSSANRNFASMLAYLNSKKVYYNQNWKVFNLSMQKEFKGEEETKIIHESIVFNINKEFKQAFPKANLVTKIDFQTK